MARIKDWLIDMEESVYYALSKGITSHEEIVSFVKKSMDVCDEDYIRDVIDEYLISCYDQYAIEEAEINF